MSPWFYGARSSAVQRASMIPAELCCAFRSPHDACAVRLSNREICIPVVSPNFTWLRFSPNRCAAS